MDAAAPAIFVAIEQSGLGAAIRQSVWAYPLANVTHIVGLTLFAASVAVMDLRLLGAFAETGPARVIRPARRSAMAAFALMLASGAALFVAEASHIVMNPVFQIKVALIALALANAATLGRRAVTEAVPLAPGQPMPPRVRRAAALSIGLWLAVAAAGRLIAYV